LKIKHHSASISENYNLTLIPACAFGRIITPTDLTQSTLVESCFSHVCLAKLTRFQALILSFPRSLSTALAMTLLLVAFTLGFAPIVLTPVGWKGEGSKAGATHQRKLILLWLLNYWSWCLLDHWKESIPTHYCSTPWRE